MKKSEDKHLILKAPVILLDWSLLALHHFTLLPDCKFFFCSDFFLQNLSGRKSSQDGKREAVEPDS